MKIETYQCDECGTQKGATNHWWVMWETFDGSERRFHFGILGTYQGTQCQHICGQECAAKALAKWMAAQ